jgi:hypothetical protein
MSTQRIIFVMIEYTLPCGNQARMWEWGKADQKARLFGRENNMASDAEFVAVIKISSTRTETI